MPSQHSGKAAASAAGASARPYTPAQLDAPILLTLLTAANKPLRLDAILRVARVTRNEKAWIENLLQKLVHNGQLVRMHGGAWLPVSMVHTVIGRYAVQRSGVGFVTPLKGGAVESDDTEKRGDKVDKRAHARPPRVVQDIFIHPAQAGEAWHGDLVKVAVTPPQGKSAGKKPEGRIIEVLERAQTEVVVRVMHAIGTKVTSKLILCRAADPRLIVQFQVDPTGLAAMPRAGELLAVTPQKRLTPDLWAAVATRSFGCEDDVAVQERLVKLNHKVPDAFPPAALDEAAALGADPSAADMAEREDLRHLPFVTIDGHSARDFDDAIHVEKQGKGWLLRVAIADVTHYVRPHSALDKEAQERANSWYFPTSVEPMLPEALSNGLCSLKPAVDRLVMVAEIAIAANGQAGASRFAAGVIRSAARLTYEEVQAAVVDNDAAGRAKVLEKAGSAHSAAGACLTMLEETVALSKVLVLMREERGSLDFELPEPEYVFDDQGVIINIKRRVRLFAHRMIEECMIAANEAVARFLEAKHTPFVFRVHPEPEPDRLAGLFRTLASTSLAPALPPKPDASHVQALIREAKGGQQEFLVGRLCLRTMPQARYQPENEGHFGLASTSYCHFTSPIRRYADM
ncbi:MAG: VacB/RNase II family 3'-5' exoribonuclease, partial [Desulfovibrionaceae bacterium]